MVNAAPLTVMLPELSLLQARSAAPKTQTLATIVRILEHLSRAFACWKACVVWQWQAVPEEERREAFSARWGAGVTPVGHLEAPASH